MVRVRLPDGSVKEYHDGVTAREVAEGIGKRLADAAVAATAEGRVVDLNRPLEDGHETPIDLKILTSKDREALDVLRHSTAHIMARAIMRLFPGVRLAFGPTTANGFYYDVVVPGRNLSEDDFPAIEVEMARITKDAEPFERFSLPAAEARQFVADLGQTFKVEHIDDELHKYGVLSFYRQGEFVDLCRGPHIPHAGKVGAFKLLSIAGAYWKGQTDRDVLQRVYGTAFFDKKDLEAYVAQVEEAKKRDHRRLGRELNLFTVSQLVGPGLILWMPKGAVVRGILESFIKDELVRRGYQPVYTPHIGRIELYQTSGHYPYYKDSQFPTLKMPADAAAKELLDGLIADKLDDDTQRTLLARAGIPERLPDHATSGRSYFELSTAERIGYVEQTCEMEEYLLKPMNCPHHIQIYAAQPRSYRELPLRLAEFGTVYRYEQSGELSGLTPRPRLHPGRRPPVLHPRPGARRVPHDHGDDPVLPRFVPGTVGLPRPAVPERPGRSQVPGRGRRHLAARRGRHPRGPGRDGAALRGGAGRGGVLRTQGRLHRARLPRTAVAARHRAARLRPARAVRPPVHRSRQPAAPAGHDPPALRWAAWSGSWAS